MSLNPRGVPCAWRVRGAERATWNPAGVRRLFCFSPPGGDFVATGGYQQGTPIGVRIGTGRLAVGPYPQGDYALGRAALRRGRGPDEAGPSQWGYAIS